MSELAVGSLAGLSANNFVIDVASGSQLTQPGMVVGHESTTKTDTFSASVAAGGNTAVTGLSISYAAKNASNKLIITVFLGALASTTNLVAAGASVYDGTSFLSLGASPGSRTSVTATGGHLDPGGATDNLISSSLSFTIEHIPGTTSSKTYTVYVFNIRGSTETLYVNRAESDSDVDSRPRAASAIHIMEVAG